MSDTIQNKPEIATAPESAAPGGHSLTASPAAAMPLDVKEGQVMPARKRRNVILPALLLAAIGFGGYKGYAYFTEGRFLVTTDDAYVKADTAVIAAKVAGYIETVPYDNNSPVKAGDILAKIDPVDYQLAVQAAQNKLLTQDSSIARMDTQIKAQDSAIHQAQAQLDALQADAVRAASAYARTAALAQSGNATQAALEQAQADKDHTAAAVEGGKAREHVEVGGARAGNRGIPVVAP